MPEKARFGEDSPGVQAHLSIMQAIIERMAANSASCKAWCIALVSAVLVLVADKGKPNYALIAAIPTVLFLVLDSYYLALERRFRGSYNSFVMKVHDGEVASSDLYAVTPSGPALREFAKCLLSFSVWPLYLTLGGMILLVRRVVIE